MSIKKEHAPKGAFNNHSHYNDILCLLQEGTQNHEVWKHMHECGTITPRDAYLHYGILALHSRISDLRGLGAEIHKEMVYKNGSRYGVYSIEDEPVYCELTEKIECPFRDGCCHRFEPGCALDEFLEEHPELVTDDDELTIRRVCRYVE